jgi:cell division septal protein FtsQ
LNLRSDIVFSSKNREELKESLRETEEIGGRLSNKGKSYLTFAIIHLVLIFTFSFLVGFLRWIPIGFSIAAVIFASIVENSNKNEDHEKANAASKKVKMFILWSMITFALLLGIRFILLPILFVRILRTVPTVLEYFLESGKGGEMIQKIFEIVSDRI